MSEIEVLWWFKFQELLYDVNPDYIDPTKGPVDYSTFLNDTLGPTIKASYDALDTASKTFIQFIFDKIIIQERMESYMDVGFEEIPVLLKTDTKMLTWVKLMHQRLVRVATKYSPFLAKTLASSTGVTRTRESNIEAIGSGTSQNKTAVSPDNGNTTPPTSFNDWGIGDNESESTQAEAVTESESGEPKYNYEVLVDIISKRHDIMEYAEAQLASLWEYNV